MYFKILLWSYQVQLWEMLLVILMWHFISCEKYVVILRNHVFHPYVYISGSQFALWTGGVSITSEHITNENLGVLSQPD